VAENTTAEAIRMVGVAAKAGADGVMLLPAMLYAADRRETLHHFSTTARASDLPIMVYNNPISYKVDVTPEMFEELAQEEAIVAIKESSDDVRRITEIYGRTGDRFQVFTGVDNLALESILLGAVGWVAGLVCAFPAETVALYEHAIQGRLEEARRLYRWFRPLLDLDVSTKLVQNIKLAEAIEGVGTETVRAPRLPLAGEERKRVVEVIESALTNRPILQEVRSA
jgi:4-hydroxy-tetrahydrodipicolinate synthase